MAVPQCHLILKWRAYIAICTMCVICTCIMLLLHLISPIVLLHIHVVLVKAYWCMCGFPKSQMLDLLCACSSSFEEHVSCHV